MPGASVSRERILSVTLADCDVQTFRAGGKGGQNQNKRETGVRVIHRASQARGESREERSQLQNKKMAFRRMTQTDEFRRWLKIATGRMLAIEDEVERQMRDIKVEIRRDGKWVVDD